VGDDVTREERAPPAGNATPRRAGRSDATAPAARHLGLGRETPRHPDASKSPGRELQEAGGENPRTTEEEEAAVAHRKQITAMIALSVHRLICYFSG